MLQLKVIEIQKQLGADVFVRQLYGLSDPLSIHCGGLNVSQQTENWEVQTEEICIEAIKENFFALKFVKEQTKRICDEAASQNRLALQYIK